MISLTTTTATINFTNVLTLPRLGCSIRVLTHTRESFYRLHNKTIIPHSSYMRSLHLSSFFSYSFFVSSHLSCPTSALLHLLYSPFPSSCSFPLLPLTPSLQSLPSYSRHHPPHRYSFLLFQTLLFPLPFTLGIPFSLPPPLFPFSPSLLKLSLSSFLSSLIPLYSFSA